MPVGTDGLLTYDESIPLTSYGKFEFFRDDLTELTETSDIVFIGRVTDYLEAVLTIQPPVEDPWGFPRVFDAVVFTIDELLTGEVKDPDNKVKVATFALLQNRDGLPRYRISDPPINIVRAGIEHRNLPDGPKYLIYVSHHFNQGGPFYRPDLYFFNTSGGVVEILAEDKLGIGANPPLVQAVVADDSGHSLIDHGLTLADARAAVGITGDEFQESADEPNPDMRLRQ